MTSGWRPALALVLGLLIAAPAGAGDAAAHQQFVFAYRLLQRDEARDAASAFRTYLEKFPQGEKRGDARYYLALIAYRNGDLAAARRELGRMGETAIVPAHAAALLRGRVALERDDPAAALEALEGIDLAERDALFEATARYLRGEAYRAAGNPSAAAEAFARAAQLDTELRAEAHKRHGAARRVLGQPERALAAFERAIAAGDTRVAAEAALAAAETAKADARPERAAELYRIVLNDHQSSAVFPDAALGLIWMRYETGDHRAAIRAAENYADALPDSPAAEARYVGGSAAHALGEHEKAVALLSAVTSPPLASSLEAKRLYRLAASRYETGDLAETNRALDELAAHDPAPALRARARYLRALAADRAGRADRAEAALSAIIAEGPDAPLFARALRRRAALYRRSGDLEAAAADLKRYLRQAGKTTPRGVYTDPEPALALLAVQHELGRYREAAHTADRLLAGDLPPTLWQEAMFRRGLALLRMEKSRPSVEAFDALLSRYPQTAYRAPARYYRGLLRVTLDRTGAVSDLRAATGAEGLDTAQRANAHRVLFAHFRAQDDTDAALEAIAGWRREAGLEAIDRANRLWAARRLLARGEAADAVAYATSVLGDRGRDRLGVEALAVAGRARLRLDEPERAVKRLREAVSLGAGPETRLALGDALAAAGRWEEAEKAYAPITTAQKPENAARALLGAARAAREGGGPDALRTARKRLKRLVVLYGTAAFSPTAERGRIALAEVLFALGEKAAARETLKELRAEHAGGPYAAYAKALAARWDGDREGARRRLAELVGLEDPWLRRRVAELRRDAGMADADRPGPAEDR